MNTRILLKTLLVLVTAACTGSGAEVADPIALDIEGTVAAIVGTNVALALTEIAEQETPTATLDLTAAEPAIQISPAPTGFVSSGECLSAELTSEFPADDEVLLPGQAFVKFWWLRNTGDCAWTDAYTFVFQGGNSMGAEERYSFPGYVAPGQAIRFTLNLNAPADPGTHLGFWELESPAGIRFGVGAGGGAPFYVQIVVPGPTSTPNVTTRTAQSWGNIRSDGRVSSVIEIGDAGNNLSYEGFMTFEFGSIPPFSSIVYLVLDINQGLLKSGDPFTELGCLNVYADNYPGVAIWRFCSVTDLSAGVIRIGGPDAIAAFENGLAAGMIRLTLAFDFASNDDGSRDTITIKVIELRMEYIP